MKIAETLAAVYIYIYIYIDNFIREKITKLYIKLGKINLKYKFYMVDFLCPPKVLLG